MAALEDAKKQNKDALEHRRNNFNNLKRDL
jgi:hypothetical protein